MAPIMEALSESMHEDYSFLKFIIYSIPIHYVLALHLSGRHAYALFFDILLAILIAGLLAQGINNVRRNRTYILSIKPAELSKSCAKSTAVLLPVGLICWFIGFSICKIPIPVNIPYFSSVVHIIIWTILFSLIITSFLSFAKYLKMKEAFKIKLIIDSCIDVLISILSYIPIITLINIFLIGPILYMLHIFEISYSNWLFVEYCSIIFVIDISVSAIYLAQTAYEQIKGNNEEYDDIHQIDLFNDSIERITKN
ncbi:hypothetical protein IJ541_09875 [bacterium]|nr:hypothetical protein [bacterium]